VTISLNLGKKNRDLGQKEDRKVDLIIKVIGKSALFQHPDHEPNHSEKMIK
jgi:hypothetical protein